MRHSGQTKVSCLWRCPQFRGVLIEEFILLCSVSRHQPEVNLLNQQWAEFHGHYQSFHQWLKNMDTEMANLNPFISNMATVQVQLAKLKVTKTCNS